MSEVGALQFEESCEQFIQLHRAAPPIVVGRVDAEQSFITPVASREENGGHENEHEFFMVWGRTCASCWGEWADNL